ncbi:MAG: pyridoxamine 5'-phosphate oxidase family protein [Ferruginibacter sp.]
MNSINQNQPEDNHEDLKNKEAVEKIKELVKKAGACFFCTDMHSGKPFQTRPMAVQEVDGDGDLWFLVANDSHVYEQTLADKKVQLLFQGSAHSDFLVLNGTAKISADKEKIKELWNPFIKTWFTEGFDDPRIAVIQVINNGGYYWDNKHGNAIAFAKMTVGAIMGKTLDDSIEGKVKP